jgi:hypothetical protein
MNQKRPDHMRINSEPADLFSFTKQEKPPKPPVKKAKPKPITKPKPSEKPAKAIQETKIVEKPLKQKISTGEYSPFGRVPRIIPRVPEENNKRMIYYCRRCDTYYYPEEFTHAQAICINCGWTGYSAKGWYPWKQYPEIDQFNLALHKEHWETYPAGATIQ